MKMIAKLCFSLALLATTFLYHPRIASANCSACLNQTHTVSCWSKASSCAAAQSNLVSVCAIQAGEDGNCGLRGGVCNTTITSQNACFWNGTQWQIDATAVHGCMICG
jgi:ribosomal protein L31